VGGGVNKSKRQKKEAIKEMVIALLDDQRKANKAADGVCLETISGFRDERGLPGPTGVGGLD